MWGELWSFAIASVLLPCCLLLTSAGKFSGLCSGNCTNETDVTGLSCFNVNNSSHKCGYCASETELGVAVGGSPYPSLRIPDDHMSASSARSNYGAARARIGDGGWCASSSNPGGSIWLQVNFEVPTDVERIVTQGVTVNGINTWVRQYSVNYSTDGGSTWVQYAERGGKTVFNAQSSQPIYIKQTTYVRIISNSTWTQSCLRLAIYGCPGVAEVIRVTVGPTTPVVNTMASSDEISAAMFRDGYQLWLVFLVIFLVLLLFSVFYLSCMVLKNRQLFLHKSETYQQKNHVEKNGVVTLGEEIPPWRRIDPEVEERYVAKQEIQEVEFSLGDEYIEKHEDAPENTTYSNEIYQDRHRVFSFSGRQQYDDHHYYNQATILAET